MPLRELRLGRLRFRHEIVRPGRLMLLPHAVHERALRHPSPWAEYGAERPADDYCFERAFRARDGDGSVDAARQQERHTLDDASHHLESVMHAHQRPRPLASVSASLRRRSASSWRRAVSRASVAWSAKASRSRRSRSLNLMAWRFATVSAPIARPGGPRGTARSAR